MSKVRKCVISQWEMNQIPNPDRRLTTAGKEYLVIRTENKYDIILDDNKDELKVGGFSAYFNAVQEAA